jgi:hypothetical protein
MTVSLKHTFTSAKIDSADPTIVQPSNWNEEHVLTAAAGKVLGRDTSGNGVVQELPISVTAAGNVTIPNNFAVTGTTGLTGTTTVVNLTSTGTATLTNLGVTGTTTLTNALTVPNGGTGVATLPANNVLIGNGTSAVTGVAPGASGNVLISNGTSWASATFGGSEIIRVPRTSNTQIGAANRSNLIDITSGTFSQTFAAAATLTSGWFCYLRNSGTGDITLDPNGSETIDGLTSYIMYPGECRLVQCDGTALITIVLDAFYRVFTATGTFTKPPGYTAISGLLWGGGGSGAAGSSQNGGGGGGACNIFTVDSGFLSASCAVTIAAGGASAVSLPGNVGGNSSFDGKFSAFGGGGGPQNSAANAGGGGGGVLSAGFSSGGGRPGGSVTGGNPGFGGAQGVFTVGDSSYAGGASGGGTNGNSDAQAGGSSVFGGAGGGSMGVFGAGGGGGGAAGGTSIYGGNGGASANTTGVAGSAPGGGGGAANNSIGATNTSGAGARGELRLWGIV